MPEDFENFQSEIHTNDGTESVAAPIRQESSNDTVQKEFLPPVREQPSCVTKTANQVNAVNTTETARNIPEFQNPYIQPQPLQPPMPPQDDFNRFKPNYENNMHMGYGNASPYNMHNAYGMPVQPQQNIPPYQPPMMPNGGFEGYPYGIPNTFNPTVMPQNPLQEKKKKHTGLKIFAFCGTTVLVAALVSAMVFMMYQGDENIVSPPDTSQSSSKYQGNENIASAPEASADPNGPQVSVQSTPEDLTATPAISAYKKASPSVVGITSYEAGTDYVITQNGEGSGIVLTADGYIATNSHVVNDSMETGVMVTLATGEQYLGSIIGIDKKTDIAVIKIDAKDLTYANFADSSSLVIGQTAFAIGNPGGLEFSNSLTQGTVSSINRMLSSNGYVKYIQTDAAINPGNSGGALINEYGQVVGMNTAKIVGTDYEGMGFAIPSNQLLEIVNKLIKYGYVNDRATLGIEGKTSTLYNSKMKDVPQGMILTNIKTESPLFDTKAITGDIIIQIDDTEVKSSQGLIEILQSYKPGDEVTLKLYRTKENSPTGAYEYTLTVQLLAETGK